MSTSFRAVAVAILKGFLRDKMSVFFAVVFPLMFLVLFGGIFNFDESPRLEVVQVGEEVGEPGPADLREPPLADLRVGVLADDVSDAGVDPCPDVVRSAVHELREVEKMRSSQVVEVQAHVDVVAGKA